MNVILLVLGNYIINLISTEILKNQKELFSNRNKKNSFNDTRVWDDKVICLYIENE